MMIRVCVIYIFVLRPTTATPWPFVSCLPGLRFMPLGEFVQLERV